MKNSKTDIKFRGGNCRLIQGIPVTEERLLKNIYKAGLQSYTVSELSLYLECLIEVINEKKEKNNERNN
jgi:hypothetical protein